MGVARRYVLVVAMLAALGAPAAAGANAHRAPDGRGIGGRLDIRWVEHGHTVDGFVHTIATWRPFASRALRGANMVGLVFDTDGNGGNDAERSVVVYWDGRVRGVLVDDLGRPLGDVAVTRPRDDRLRVTIPSGLLAAPVGYRWLAATVDGSAEDFAPDTGMIVHDFTAPTIVLREFPEIAVPATPRSPWNVRFTVRDRGFAGLAAWRLQRRILGASEWVTVRSGKTGGTFTPSLTGRQGASYELRVVAADRQRNRSVSEKRIVTLPLDDAHSAFATSYGGTWTAETELPGYYAGTRRSTSDPVAEFVKLFDGTRVAWVAPTGAAFGTAEVSIDGAAVESVDLSAPEAVRAVVFDVDDLAPGAHTIAIRRTSGTIAVDGIAVR